MTDEPYANIREILGHLIGRTLIEITQHDKEDFLNGEDSFVELMFNDGNTLKFFALDSKLYKVPGAFCFSDPNGETEEDEYVPTEEDRATKGWIVVEKKTDPDYPVHVLPNFGRNHILTMDCWCRPKLDEYREDPIVNHNEELP